MVLTVLLIKEALISIWRHKFRSFLAFIGVSVGITAVIALVSLGSGVKKDVTASIEDIGTNLIIVIPGKLEADATGFGSGQMANPANLISADILKFEDVESIAEVPGVRAAAPISMVAGNLRRDDKLSAAMTIGSTEKLKEVFSGYNLKHGRFITDEDWEKNVVVVGDFVRQQLFDGEDNNIVGQKILLNRDEFEIIGQLEKPREAGELFASDFDSVAIIPFSTARLINKEEDKILRISAAAERSEEVLGIVGEIEARMEERHSTDDFSVLTQEDLLGVFSSVIDLLTGLVTAIAAISLVVGGIGISSVMFISVADRTKEIGVRKAIGASGTVILLQFLLESIILAVIGGAVGLAGAFAANHLIGEKLGISPELTSGVVFLALGFCMGVGITFGLIPAWRAAAKDPVEALREG